MIKGFLSASLIWSGGNFMVQKVNEIEVPKVLVDFIIVGREATDEIKSAAVEMDLGVNEFRNVFFHLRNLRKKIINKVDNHPELVTDGILVITADMLQELNTQIASGD